MILKFQKLLNLPIIFSFLKLILYQACSTPEQVYGQTLSAEQNVESSPLTESEGPSGSEGQPEEPAIYVPYSSSPIYLTLLAKVEQQVFSALNAYEKELKKRLRILQSYRKDYEDSVIQGAQVQGKDAFGNFNEWSKATLVSSHPFLAFQMIRRFSKYIKDFNEHLWKSLESELWENLEKIRGPLMWPTDVDLNSAAKSVIRIQDTHDFDINFFTAGAIRDHWLQVRLTAQQCLEISKLALKLGDINSATEWFQVAHSKAVHGRNDNSVGMDELTEAWEQTYKTFQTYWPVDMFKSHDVFGESKALLRQTFQKLKVNRTYEHRIINYKALCRGDKLRSPAEETQLICYFDHWINSFWLLQPLKVEIHNWDPIIYQIYDFAGPQSLMDISSESTIPAFISSAESGDAGAQNVHEERSFTSSWIHDAEASASLNKLTKNLRIMTSNLGQLGPQFHVSAYAVGNHHEPCVQCLEIDNRVLQHGIPRAVVEINLHEPEHGGEVAFTLLGVLVKPVQGSVLLYNTLGSNGEFDYRMLHGNCPVIIGRKWVAHKWIYDASA